jgi:putative SOS response-associated peptidase YedK
MKAVALEAEKHKIGRFTGFSHPFLPVILQGNSLQIRHFQWGLLPEWVKDFAAAKKLSDQTLNAVAETLQEKPSFKGSVDQRRCLILVDSFLEWRHSDSGKQGYRMKLTADNSPVRALGGLWSFWKEPVTGTPFNTFTIITTEANEEMAWVHNTKKRMPLVLEESQFSIWLSGVHYCEVQPLVRPLPDGSLLPEAL